MSPLPLTEEACVKAFLAARNAVLFDVNNCLGHKEVYHRASLAGIRAVLRLAWSVEPTEEMKLAGGMIPENFKGTSAARGNADRVFKAMQSTLLRGVIGEEK